MRFAFVIRRLNYLRAWGPLVDAALRRGWPVELWLDWSQPAFGPKASEFPAAVPIFRAGRPETHLFDGDEDLVHCWLARAEAGQAVLDAVLLNEPEPPLGWRYPAPWQDRPKWVMTPIGIANCSLIQRSSLPHVSATYHDWQTAPGLVARLRRGAWAWWHRRRAARARLEEGPSGWREPWAPGERARALSLDPPIDGEALIAEHMAWAGGRRAHD